MSGLPMINATALVLMWALLIKNGLGSIYLKVEPLVVKIGKSDIDIRCIVDGTTLSSILSIQLIRSNTTVVTVTQNRVALEDAALENKTGVTVNASISNVMSSYLHLKISKRVVRYPEDLGSYQCSLLALDSLGGLVRDHSLIVNITGFSASTFQSTSERYFSQTNQKNTKEILPCTCSNGNTLTLYMQSYQKKDCILRQNNKVNVGAMYIVANHGRYEGFCLEEKAMQTTDRSLRRWRYILVSKQKQRTALPLPTPLEEQLLAERFPMMGEQVYRQHSDLALRSKKMTYCLEYTPFVNQWA